VDNDIRSGAGLQVQPSRVHLLDAMTPDKNNTSPSVEDRDVLSFHGRNSVDMSDNTTIRASWQLDSILGQGSETVPKPFETALWIREIGSNPVVIPAGKKGPDTKNWHQVRYETLAEAKEAFGDSGNVGILLGNEHGVVDIDLDCPEAAAVARYLLPQDTAIFGRQGSPRSHYLYSCENAGEGLRLKDGPGKVTVELRSQPGGKACQTVMPGSVHPTGEAVVWWDKRTPMKLPFEKLAELVNDIHGAAVLLRGYPAEGSRHDFWLAAGGLWAKSGVPKERALRIMHAVFSVAESDPTEMEDRRKAVETSYERSGGGKSCVGWSALEQHVNPGDLRSLGFSEKGSGDNKVPVNNVSPTGGDIIDMEYLVHPCQFMKEEAGALGIRVTRRGEGGRLVDETLVCLQNGDGQRSILSPDVDRIETSEGTLDLLLPMAEAEGTRQWSFADAKAWESHSNDPVDIPTTIEEIIYLLEHYIDLPDEYRKGAIVTLAYWILMSYCFTAWHAVPYVSLTGERGCGKSRVLDCLSELVYSPVIASNMSEPAMFRTMNSTCGTLLYDEAEAVADKDRVELLTMLNAGHQSKFAIARRCEKKAKGGFSVVDYRIFGPKAFAAIKTLPPALLSRSIIIPMVRASSSSPKIKRRVHTAADSFEAIRNSLHIAALENHALWHHLSMAPMPSGMAFSGRQIDLWQPIFALASEYTPNYLEVIAAFAGISQSIEEERLENPAHKAVLEVLYDMRVQGKQPSGAEILDYLKVYGPSGLFDRWISSTIGKTLSNFGIRSKRTREGDNRKRVYSLKPDEISDVASRHGYFLSRSGNN